MKKKIFAIILALVVVMSLTPTVALADEPVSQTGGELGVSAAVALPLDGTWVSRDEVPTAGFFAGSWTWTSASPVLLTVTDFAVVTDAYKVYDNGGLVLSTPLLPDWDDLGLGNPFDPPFTLNIDVALATSEFSKGVFIFGPGSHEITIEVTQIPTGFSDSTVAIKAVEITPIKTDVFTWTSNNLGGGTGDVEIVEYMLNESDTEAMYEGMGTPGVTGQEAFVYAVTNVSWVPVFGTNGFSGFNIYNQFDVGTVGNAFGPLGWEAFAGYSGVNTPPNPDNFEWDIKNSNGNGLFVGESGLFGFTVEAGRFLDVDYGTSGHWMHSWYNDSQVDTFTTISGISGPAPMVTKELISITYPDGSVDTGPFDTPEVPIHTVLLFEMLITVVNNDATDDITDLMVMDNFGGDLELVSVNGVLVPAPTNKKDVWDESDGAPAGVSVLWTGKTLKAHLSWDVGTLAPGESDTLTIIVATDINPGQEKKDPGVNEYTSTGIHELNSGATAIFNFDGMEWEVKSAPISVEAVLP